MGSIDPPADTVPFIDMCRALDLLASAVRQAGRDVEPSRCLIGRAFSLAGVGGGCHDVIGEHNLRELYAQDRLPVRLTLGALVVFDAAQRAQDRGLTVDNTLGCASSAAVRFIDLLPDRVFVAAINDPSVMPGSAKR